MKLNDPVNPYLGPPEKYPPEPPEWDEFEERIERRPITYRPGRPEEGMTEYDADRDDFWKREHELRDADAARVEFLMEMPESDRENYDRMQDERAESDEN